MKARRDQHFLIDRRAIDFIADALPVCGRRVLEIGPGEGPLTRALLDRGAVVVAIEIDTALCAGLAERFGDEIAHGTLFLLNDDAVRCEIPPFDLVVANLPYSASSKITFRLLDIGFEAAVLMYQKEFAQRMIARPGTPGCGRLSVMVQTYARVKPILSLSPRSFRPRPQVSSWVVRMTPKDPPVPINNHVFYADVVRALFSHRRKTIRKGLKTSVPVLGEERVHVMTGSLPDAILNARPETLSLVDFALIANTGWEAAIP